MIKDLIVSFKDNFKDKVKNPFLGTYVLIWLFKNWDLVFTFFNFDKGITLNKKIELINSYFKANPFLKGILINIVLTFLVLVITYILLNISRGIVNIFEKQLKPIVYKLTDKSSIVLKEDLDKLKNERDNLLVRISKERESKSKVELELQKMTNQLNDYLKNQFEEENQEFEETKYIKEYNKLKEKGLIKLFKSTTLDILKGEKFLPGNLDRFTPFLELGLIKLKSQAGSYRTFEHTKTGKEVLEIIRINE